MWFKLTFIGIFMLLFPCLVQADTISGIVISEPGQFYSQYFFISQDENIAQIYNYKKEFPSLRIGDLVEAQGSFSDIKEMRRLRTKEISDIQIISQNHQLYAPVRSCHELEATTTAQLAQLQGQITKVGKSDLYLTDDSGEVLIKIDKALGERPNLNLNDKLHTVILCLPSREYCRLLSFAPNFFNLKTSSTNPAATLASSSSPKISFNPKKKIKQTLTSLGAIIALTCLLFFARMK